MFHLGARGGVAEDALGEGAELGREHERHQHDLARHALRELPGPEGEAESGARLKKVLYRSVTKPLLSRLNEAYSGLKKKNDAIEYQVSLMLPPAADMRVASPSQNDLPGASGARRRMAR